MVGFVGRPWTTAALGTLAALGWLLAIAPVMASDFRSVAEGGAILYDGPSLKARGLFVATAYLPVELIASDGKWNKVRDPSGDLAWVEAAALSTQRTVMAVQSVVSVRQSPSDKSTELCKVVQGVALDYADQSGVPPGWVKVRHRDGLTGFVRISQVWGT